MAGMANPRQLGVDLSHWQGEGGLSAAKWDRLKKCNVRWAILKATQGTGHVDNAFVVNLRRARKHGIERGAYHFLVRGSGRAQAQHFISTVKRANGGSLKNILLVVDVERDPSNGTFPTATNVRSFLREVNRVAKRNAVLVYTSGGAWRAIGNPDMANLAGLWQARWDGKRHTCKQPNLPKRPPRAGFGGWAGRPRFWQYGSFRYGLGRMDGNALYTSRAKMLDLFRTVKPKPVPKPIEDRPRYRLGYNALLEVATTKLLAIADPTRLPGRAWEAGVDEARADAIDAIEQLTISEA